MPGGIAYEKSGETHLFRLDPHQKRIELLLAADYSASALSADQFRDKSGAQLVINGGFFDERSRSLGLIVRKGQQLNPLRRADWGIFQLKAGIPTILHRQQWSRDGVEMALQVGPRLVIDGSIPPFKPEAELHRRSAIGITPEGWIVIALSDRPIAIHSWAELLQKASRNALNLDGGGSSQISVKLDTFSLNLPGTTAVPNAVAVFAK